MTDENIVVQEEVKLDSVLDYYNVLRTLTESIESDVLKAERGNKAAGVRLRKSLRFLKGHAGDFVKFTLGK